MSIFTYFISIAFFLRVTILFFSLKLQNISSFKCKKYSLLE